MATKLHEQFRLLILYYLLFYNLLQKKHQGSKKVYEISIVKIDNNIKHIPIIIEKDGFLLETGFIYLWI